MFLPLAGVGAMTAKILPELRIPELGYTGHTHARALDHNILPATWPL